MERQSTDTWQEDLTIDVIEQGFDEKAGMVDRAGNGTYCMKFVACGDTSAEIHVKYQGQEAEGSPFLVPITYMVTTMEY